MFTRPVLTAALCVTLAACTLTLRADDTADAKKAIEANYATINAAMNKPDLNAVFALYSPDYTDKDKSGKITTLRQLKENAPSLEGKMQRFNMHFTTKVQSVSVTGKTATATYQIASTMQMSDPDPKKHGHTINASGTSQCSDVWTRKNGKWLIKSHRILSSHSAVVK